MSLVTIIWSMTASGCLVLAAIHLFIWIRQREHSANLAYSLVALSVALFTGLEAAAMYAQTPQAYLHIFRLLHIPICTFVISMVWFTRTFLKAGRAWLGGVTILLQIITLVPNFLSEGNLDYRGVPVLKQVQLLGETVTSAVANPPAHFWLGHLSLFLLLVFIIDASITDWRRGNHRRAAVVGGASALFMVYATIQSTLVLVIGADFPVSVGIAYTIALFAMGFELSSEVLRASQLARSLHENEKQVELAAAAAGLGYWSWDLSRNNIHASREALELFGGAPPGPITFETFLERVFEEDRAAVQAKISTSISDGTEYQTEYRVKSPSGEQRWIAARGRAERNEAGRPVIMRGVVMDVTERKNAEERFRQVVEASPSAIVLVNAGGKITLVNRQTERLFGYRADELIGQPVDMLLPARARDRHPGHRDRYMASPETRPMGQGRDLFARRRDGTEFAVEVGLNPIRTAQGTFVLSVIIDISSRRQAEEEIAGLRDRLSHAGRVSTMGQLASALAHEINQPLGAILRNAEAAELVLKSANPDLEELRAIIEDILSDDLRAGKVIDRLRGLLRRRELELHPLAVHELLEGVSMLVRADASVRRVKIELDLPANSPTVKGDSVQLQQVLINLILNAMDAIANLPQDRRLVVMAARENGDAMVEVSVSDLGEGIAPDKLPRMFEPFFTTKAQGMGMGLPISRTIVEAHGGRIWAENNPNGGATVRFTLPLHHPEPAA